MGSVTSITNKIWSSQEWRRKHAEFTKGKKCSWCGADKSLVVHHTKRFVPYRKIIYKEALRLLNVKIAQGEYKLLILKRKVCPSCKSSKIYTRRKALPLYRCKGCASVFEEPLEIKKETKRVSREDWNSFYSKYKIYNEDRYNAYAKAFKEYYLSFNDCVVLCNKCHFSLHQGFILCKTCKQRYHYPRYKICSKCNPNYERKQRNKLNKKSKDMKKLNVRIVKMKS